MSLISKLLRVTGDYGPYQLARWLTRNRPRILMYHRFSEAPRPGYVSAEVFREHVRHIKHHFNPISLQQLVAMQFEGGDTIPNAVVITVDDGYRDFYDVAYPILLEEGVPATLFVTTGFVNGDLWLWPDKVRWIIHHSTPAANQVQLGERSISTEDARRNPDDTWQQLVEHLLAISDVEKHLFIGRMAKTWNVDLPINAPRGFESCSWTELREMQANGIEIGGHTVTHPSLGRVDLKRAQEEIQGCATGLRSELGGRSRPFCYPNGTIQDYTPDVARLVAESGFFCAVTAFPDALGCTIRYAMRRHVGAEDRLQFMKSVSGMEHLGTLARNQELDTERNTQFETVVNLPLSRDISQGLSQ
jgi:peptidoglycan/xylan/chitin deacetylase (PgdA/CDA1 family)